MGKGKTSTRLANLLNYFSSLHPQEMDFSLGRVQKLLARLGDPQCNLPPTIHIAGTNGKGSTGATILAMARSCGLKVHVMTSPHLITIEERYRIANQLVGREELVKTLEHLKEVNGGQPITLFEALTVTGFFLFALYKADLCIIEVGLGGRLDATNVIENPSLCVLTSISRDHEAFLGDSLQAIAREKAGIIKQNVPVISAHQERTVQQLLEACAQACHAPLYFVDKPKSVNKNSFTFKVPWNGNVELSRPSLHGNWQLENTALAFCAMRYLFPEYSTAQANNGLGLVSWPARMQQLHGTVAQLLPKNWELWLDGGHNEAAAEAIISQLRKWQDLPLILLIGMKEDKAAATFIKLLLPYADQIWTVSEKGQYHAYSAGELAKMIPDQLFPGENVQATIHKIMSQQNFPTQGRMLICGSLYLAGIVLKQDGFEPS